MSKVDILRFTSDELEEEKLKKLIKQKQSFQIVTVKNIGHTVNKIEGAIEREGLKCRVYTENRSSLLAGFIPNPLYPLTFFAATGAATASALHNIATFNPDYEIGKNIIKSTINVTYKKE